MLEDVRIGGCSNGAEWLTFHHTRLLGAKTKSICCNADLGFVGK